MKKIKALIAAQALLLLFSGQAMAEPASPLVGSWCFYEQSGFGNTFPEKVDIAFHADGTYLWQEGAYKQEGTWEATQETLTMSDVGAHRIISIKDEQMELERISIMRFRKSACGEASFSDQDVIRFQNAASTGEMQVMEEYIGKNIDIDIIDWRRGDTALIKAAKFCEIAAAKYLLEKGADKAVRNHDEKSALDYAKSSDFHKGCNELVSALQ